MEFWWWIEPLSYTGVVTLILAILIGNMFQWNNVSIDIAIILMLPLVVSVVAAFLWFLANIFVGIWSPYFG